MTTGRINQVTAFPIEKCMHIHTVCVYTCTLHGSVHLREGIVRKGYYFLAAWIPEADPADELRRNIRNSNCLEAFLSFLPALSQRYESGTATVANPEECHPKIHHNGLEAYEAELSAGRALMLASAHRSATLPQ